MPVAGTALGDLRAMRDDRVGGLLRFNAQHGDIGRFTLPWGSVVFVNSPELVHDVLVAKAKQFEKSPILRAVLYPLAGDGLFTSDGDLWRTQRKRMAPIFQPSNLARFAGDMTASAERVAASLEDGTIVDVARETTRIAMSVAGRTLFSVDTFDETDELGEALTTALEWAGDQSGSLSLIVQSRVKIALDLVADRLSGPVLGRARGAVEALAERAIVPVLWPTARDRALRGAIAVLDARVGRMIEERKVKGSTNRDLLSLLLAGDETGSVMSDRQVRDEVLTLFVAGHETTANVLAWALMLLALHPRVAERVREEADGLGRTPTYEDLPKLPLTLRVFKETMRLYPPAFMFGRVSVAEVQVGPWPIPNGTVVLVSPFALQRRPEYYPDPERFDPDRFLPEREAIRPKTAYIPFGAGPRTCIGNTFALMEGPLVLATLLRRVELALVNERGAEPEAKATLRPRGGLPMRVRVRRPS